MKRDGDKPLADRLKIVRDAPFAACDCCGLGYRLFCREAYGLIVAQPMPCTKCDAYMRHMSGTSHDT